MNIVCNECGFKFKQDFKFCPNCGSELNSFRESYESINDSKPDVPSVVCQNCGEDNSASDLNCSSCGVKLKKNTMKEIKKNSDKSQKIRHPNKNKKVGDEIYIAKEKTLDNKKILFLSSAVIIIFFVLLIASGVLEFGLNPNHKPITDESRSNVNLDRVNEINELESRVEADPGDKKSIIELANLLQDSGLYDRAIIYYKKYLQIVPNDPDARVDMGICLYNINDFSSAISEMERALEYHPGHQLANLNLGIVNLTEGNVGIAKELFRKALEIDPESQAGKRAQELLQSH
jgi:tetratricopeptide (TPR) repeat protein